MSFHILKKDFEWNAIIIYLGESILRLFLDGIIVEDQKAGINLKETVQAKRNIKYFTCFATSIRNPWLILVIWFINMALTYRG
jgi:hypothetical protein